MRLLLRGFPRSEPAMSALRSFYSTQIGRSCRLPGEELLAKRHVRRRPRVAGVGLPRLRRLLLDAGVVTQRRLIARVHDAGRGDAVADGEDERVGRSCAHDHMRDVGGAVEVVPLPEW